MSDLRVMRRSAIRSDCIVTQALTGSIMNIHKTRHRVVSASGSAAGLAALPDGSSGDSAFGKEQIGGVLVHIDALATAAIAARAAHGVIDGREAS